MHRGLKKEIFRQKVNYSVSINTQNKLENQQYTYKYENYFCLKFILKLWAKQLNLKLLEVRNSLHISWLTTNSYSTQDQHILSYIL